MPAPPSPKRLPSADRRAQILEASAALFIQRGFETVTMGDIAQTLGISRPTVYSYFSSPEAVLDALLQERLDALLKRLDPLLCGKPGEARAAPGVIEAVFRCLQKERDTVALLHSGGGPSFQARRHAFLNDLGARLHLQPDLSVRRHPNVLWIVTTLLDALAFRAAQGGGAHDDLARDVGTFVQGGLRAFQHDDPDPR